MLQYLIQKSKEFNYQPSNISNINTIMRKKKLKIRNPVARYARLFNKATVVPDKTKYNRKKDKKVSDADID